MTEQIRCGVDDWVEVEGILLETADRSKNLPADTAAQPLRMWIKGFAQAEANVGEEVTVEVMVGVGVTVAEGVLVGVAVKVGVAVHVGVNVAVGSKVVVLTVLEYHVR